MRYRFRAPDLPTNKEYIVWNAPAGNDKPVAMLRIEVDSTGRAIYDFEGERGELDKLLVKIQGYVKAQPVRFALISTDGSVRSFVKKIPFPVTHQQGACKLSVEMMTSDTYQVLLSGFRAGETVEVTADLGRQPLKERFVVPNRIQGDVVQREILLPFQRKSGRGTVKAVAHSCTVSASYEWGAKAKVQ